jgi:hypothetical protein
MLISWGTDIFQIKVKKLEKKTQKAQAYSPVWLQLIIPSLFLYADETVAEVLAEPATARTKRDGVKPEAGW